MAFCVLSGVAVQGVVKIQNQRLIMGVVDEQIVDELYVQELASERALTGMFEDILSRTKCAVILCCMSLDDNKSVSVLVESFSEDLLN